MIEKIFTEHRPWGSYTLYNFNEICTVKILEVKKGEVLSLQSHELRDELWVALDDGAKVEKDGEVVVLKKREEAFLPKRCKHRLSAPDSDVRVLEISYGVFDEHDEVRYEDKYGRV